jgi:hypothetical protein
MLILRYFLIVGPLLSALIFAWGNYLEPLSVPNLSAAEVTKNEVFRPTPAPPIQALNSVDIQAPAAEPDPRNVQAAPSKVARVHQPKPKKTIVRSRHAPDNSLAYAPTAPFFFGWR